MIPKATSAVPKFGRLFTPPSPPAPKLRPTAEARTVSKEVVPKPPPVPKAAKSEPPVKAKERLIPREPDHPPPAAPVEEGFNSWWWYLDYFSGCESASQAQGQHSWLSDESRAFGLP